MIVKAGYSTPLLEVADVERSLRFYELLGFETVDVEGGPDSLGWARMHCEGGALMFVRTSEPVVPGAERFLLYLYTPDLPALRRQLAEADVEVGAIGHPEHMRSGEMCLEDPDGYRVLIGHWGEQEHAAWLDRLEEKRAQGLIRGEA